MMVPNRSPHRVTCRHGQRGVRGPLIRTFINDPDLGS